MMVLLLAWRNTWRNPTRSLVVIIAIGLGIWAAMFMTGFATGMARGYINNAINQVLSHIQIHNPAFKDDQAVENIIPDIAKLVEEANKIDGVKGISVRTVVNGMIASGKATRGIIIKGIQAENEIGVTDLSEGIIDGTYFEDKRKNQILVGKKMAERLGVQIRSKLVLTFQDMEGTITAGAFRVGGIFESGNAPFDESHVFVQKKDIDRLLLTNTENGQSIAIAHEVALMLEQPDLIDQAEEHLQTTFPKLQVETYREIAPDLQLYESQIQNISMIYLVVIMLALIFGIINTMLMAVLERIKELGMLMAIGMNKLKVFSMIVCETLLLSFIGAPLGILLGWLTVQSIGNYGLDLSAFSESLQMYGLSEKVYFELDPIVYIQIPLTLIFTALIAAIYPAWKAIQLRPVEALQKI